MIKYTIIFVTLIFLSACIEGNHNECRKIVRVKSNNNMLEEEYTLNNKGEVDGYYKSFYSDGSLEIYSQMKEGLKDGIFKEFFKNGKLSRSTNYVNDIENGTEIQFYKNGNVKGIRNIKNDSINGLTVLFYENGFMKAKYLTKNDHFIGHVYEYYDNGFLHKYKRFYDNGKLAYLREYGRDGKFKREDGSGIIITVFEKVENKDSIFIPLKIELVNPPNTRSLLKVYQYNNPDNILKKIEVRDTLVINYRLNKANGDKLKILADIVDSIAISKFERELEFVSGSYAVKDKK